MSPVVYRVYDKSGRLIYVGASTNLQSRLKCHRSQAWWYALMDRVATESYPTAEEAFAAEAEAIRSEQPAFNAVHTGRRMSRLTEDDVRVCREWIGEPGSGRAGVLNVSLRRLLARAAS